MAGQNDRDLIVWRKAMELVEAVYRLSAQFPREERFSLTDQVRRAAVAIPSNIAEGQGRGGSKQFARFLSIARGSLREMETQIMIAARLGYIETRAGSDVLTRSAEVCRMITGLMNSLSRDRDAP